MYNQLLYFVVALLLFSAQQPGPHAFLPPIETALLCLGVFGIFVFVTHLSFRRLARSFDSGITLSVLTARYHRIHARLSILALGVLAVYTYALDIKVYLRGLPWFDKSFTLVGMTGLALYVLHLLVLWTMSHPFHCRIYRSKIGLTAFLRGHLAFGSAILIPWVLISSASDLVSLVGGPGFLQTDLGQFLLLSVITGLFVLLAPPWVVRLWGCEPIPDSPNREELERFCRQWDFRVGNLLLWPLFGGEMLTAGIIGILPRMRYILITKGLLTLLNTEELKAVIAHEMGHVRRHHVLVYLAFFLLYAFFAFSFNQIILLAVLRHPAVLQLFTPPSTIHHSLLSLIHSLPVIVLLVIYIRFIFGFFLRNSERQADLFALKLIGHPFFLISALEKIAAWSGRIRDLPSWHHYGIGERIQYLLDSHRNPELIREHDRKLRSASLLYLVTFFSLSVLGLHLKDSRTVRRWDLEVQSKFIEQELKKNPDNPYLAALYGGVLLEMGNVKRAEEILAGVLELLPENATILNNLAWLYATSPPPYFHPTKALQLASRAAQLEQHPHILDTLAEAYFVKGDFEKALETIEKALRLHPKNPDYFQRQKRKFLEALDAAKR